MRALSILALCALLPLFVLGCDSSDPEDADELATFRATLQCNSVGQISMGQTINGTLATSDCRVPVHLVGDEVVYIDYYAFQLTSERTVRIDLESEAFDTVLVLFNTGGALIAFDDDGGEGLNSRIMRNLSAGTYVIGATSFDAEETGPYSIRLSLVE